MLWQSCCLVSRSLCRTDYRRCLIRMSRLWQLITNISKCYLCALVFHDDHSCCKIGEKTSLKNNFWKCILTGQHCLNKANLTQIFSLLWNGRKWFSFIIKLCINVVSGSQFTIIEKNPTVKRMNVKWWALFGQGAI